MYQRETAFFIIPYDTTINRASGEILEDERAAKELSIKTERGVKKHPTLVLFNFIGSHSLFPSYAGLSLEMHHGWIASTSRSGVSNARLYGLYLST